MSEANLPRNKLTLWALCVIAQAAAGADSTPVVPTARLRLALAWLAVATEEGPALDLFWTDARKTLPSGQTDYMNRYIRGTSLNLRLQGICERLGVSCWDVKEHAARLTREWP